MNVALKRAKSFPNTPYFIVGDINVNPQTSHEIRQSVIAGTIHDIAAEWTPAGSAIQNTFSKTGIHIGMEGNGITRIDALLSNFTGAHIVYNFEYVWDDANGFDHLPFRITINHNAFTQKNYNFTQTH